MEGFVVRDFRLEDYDAVMNIWRETGLYSEERGDDLNTIQRTIAHGGKLLVLEKEGEVLGTSWLTTDGRRLFIQYFAIRPDYQGSGLSHLLMRASLDYARLLGLQVKLEVHRNNKVARALYERYGFKPLGNYDVYILRDPASLGNGKH